MVRVISLLLTVLAAIPPHGVSVPGYLLSLDSTLRDYPRYLAAKERHIDSLRQSIHAARGSVDRYDAEMRLHEAFGSYSLDSSLVHVKRALTVARGLDNAALVTQAEIRLAFLYNTSGVMYKEAYDIFSGIDSHNLPDGDLFDYYCLGVQVYRNLATHSLDSALRDRYTAAKTAYRDSALMLRPGNDVLLANKYMDAGDWRNALYAMKGSEGVALTDRDGAVKYHVLSQIYAIKGDRMMQERYLALSAACDLRNGVREYLSLQQLAMMLYRDGDIDRAYRYIHRSISDATACNAKLRMLEMSEILPIIDSAYDMSQAESRRYLYLTCVVIGVMSVLLFVLLLFVRRKNSVLHVAKQRQEEANRRLEEVNRTQSSLNDALKNLNDELSAANIKERRLNERLLSVNRIKEEYITRFMNLCLEYLSKMEGYRRELNKIASRRDFDALYEAIKSTRYVNKEVSEFYAKFDEAFLHLFPTFVDEFNALLRPGEKVTLKKGERLNTELRIFALLRLGISDGDCVSRFLRCSFSTVYNYRTRMRNRAIDRDNFERDIMAID
ncbi:MAG: DUF6377 domain-containing protein [Pseudoflavonifractor sp.]|nr:DUF6377 domain-containing protein [Pseudoflavonifractor sp.]